MRQILLVARKDLAVFFRSPLAYAVLTCFLLIAGYIFASTINLYQLVSVQLMQSPRAADVTMQDLVVAPYLQNAAVVFLFLLPLLTMRGYAEEKRNGTFELLLSYPLGEGRIAMGKLLALCVFLWTAIALSAFGPLLLMVYATPEPLPMLVGYLGLALLATAFASLGLFISSLTSGQVVAGVTTFMILLVLWLLSWVRELVPQSVRPVVEAISPMDHFSPFSQGVLTLHDALYFLLLAAAFFWLTVLSLENQRWRRAT
ncbi:ABC transporter permease [Desulfohalovibrio reitneri]|uniref:ABC transporter permease n=1 Tax=Desulfohalovibrio reitneri TaxID=1307759 RepID=UPI0004A73F78|nr:ABC transporter permease [Desulfohalovibrio reitneri]